MLLRRHCPRIAEEDVHDLGGVTFGGFHGDQDVVLVASVPLTDESAWEALPAGTQLVAKYGAPGSTTDAGEGKLLNPH